MKQLIENLLKEAIEKLIQKGEIPKTPLMIHLDIPKNAQHGDFACNIALSLAGIAKKSPRVLAEKIIQQLALTEDIKKVELAGAGFINFFLTEKAITAIIPKILAEKINFGKSKAGRNKKVILEFVSTNPTGPLHVGHGRHAVVGCVLSNLLKAVGFETYNEYYINDSGRQMDILTVSVLLRRLEEEGISIIFPANGYRGSYINEIAQYLKKNRPHFPLVSEKLLFQDLPKDENEGGDKDIYIDALIKNAKKILGKTHYQQLFDDALSFILKDIQNDLTEFGVHFDNWFSEKSLIKTGEFDRLLHLLKEKDFTYEKENALWFKSSQFGDDKDRVLVRANGQMTYFASDIAYHLNKFHRGFDIAIDMVGSDHHGYLARIKAALLASEIDPERLVFLLLQFVSLYRQDKLVQMSTRGGNFVTLRELREEVGNDAARFFYLLKKFEQPMDFDLDLAKSKSNENPVYYVQYAYARIASVFRQLTEKGLVFDEKLGLQQLLLLKTSNEILLCKKLANFPEVVMLSAINYEPHQLINYLRELASEFHAYYNSEQFIVDDANLRNARLVLIKTISQVLFNAFSLIGIAAPESM